MGSAGTVRFVDVVEGTVCCCIEPATQRQGCVKMALDRRGNYAAMITQEGEVRQRLSHTIVRQDHVMRCDSARRTLLPKAALLN